LSIVRKSALNNQCDIILEIFRSEVFDSLLSLEEHHYIGLIVSELYIVEVNLFDDSAIFATLVLDDHRSIRCGI
jgi:hypothetical protein